MGYFYPNGISTKSGAPALLRGPIYTSQQVAWVDSANGDASYPGSYAAPEVAVEGVDVTGRIIVCKNGHAETITSAMSIAAGCTIIGETSAGGVPGAALTNNQAAGSLVDLSANDGIQFINMRFPVQSQACSATRFDPATGVSIRFVDCLFEDDTNDDNEVIETAGSTGTAHIEGCTFNASGTSVATAPTFAAIRAVSGTNRVVNCIFDDGAYGRNANYAITASGGTARIYFATLSGQAYIASNSNAGLVADFGTTQGGYVLTTEPILEGGFLSSPAGGDALAKAERVVYSNAVYYINSASGSDTNSGLVEELPMATLAAAVSAGTTGDVFVLMDGHAETITTTISLTANQTVIGDGSVTLTVGADVNGIAFNSSNIELRNVTMKAGVALSATKFLLTVTGAASTVVGCTFELDANIPSSAALNVASTANNVRVESCIFQATGAAGSTQPNKAMIISTGTIPLIKDCTFDGGATGFVSYALDGSAGAVSYVRGEGNTLKNHADVLIHASSTGYFQVDADATCVVEAF